MKYIIFLIAVAILIVFSRSCSRPVLAESPPPPEATTSCRQHTTYPAWTVVSPDGQEFPADSIRLNYDSRTVTWQKADCVFANDFEG